MWQNHQGAAETRAVRRQGKAYSGFELTASYSFSVGPISLPSSFCWVWDLWVIKFVFKSHVCLTCLFC